jgi:hypothetical protein
MALEIACEEDVLSIVTQVRIPSLIINYVYVRRSSVGCGVAQLGCGVGQLVPRRLAVRQA